jgi:hypothetical protein
MKRPSITLMEGFGLLQHEGVRRNDLDAGV